jgi:hypothetical protein
MTIEDPSLRLRFWASLILFISAYSPLLIILVIKDYESPFISWIPCNPERSFIFVLIAIISCLVALYSVKEIKSGLIVQVTKASNKSGDMFGYTIPYTRCSSFLI